MSQIHENPAVTSISNPNDRKRLRGMLEEVVACLRRIDTERESKKIILDEIKKQFGLSTKHANKLASTMFRDNFAEVQATQDDFETLYMTVVQRQIDDSARSEE